MFVAVPINILTFDLPFALISCRFNQHNYYHQELSHHTSFDIRLWHGYHIIFYLLPINNLRIFRLIFSGFFLYFSFNYYLLSCTRWKFIFYITIVVNLRSKNAIHDEHEYKASTILRCLMYHNCIWSIILLQANLVTMK